MDSAALDVALDLDPTLTYFDQRDPVNGTPKMRFTAGDAGSGPVASWTSDIGTAHVLSQATSSAKPSRNIVGITPAVVFDGTNDKLTSTYSAPATQSVYMVLKATVASKGSAQPVVAFGGIYLGLGSTGKMIAAGSAGPVQTVGSLTSGVRYAVCITLNGNAATVEVNGENVANNITTIGALNILDFGASGANFFGGELCEVCIYDVVHNQTQRTAELASLRSWWSAT